MKNADYFVKGRPYLDGIKIYIIKDDFTRVAAFRTGATRWWAPYPYMSPTHVRTIQETLSGKVTIESQFHPAWYGVTFTLNQSPWKDVRVRQAVSMSFDRNAMTKVALEGSGIVGMSPQPPGEWALPEEEMMKVPGYAKPDLEGAKRLLADAGFPQGFKATAIHLNNKPHTDVALLTKAAVAKIGIDLTLKIVEPGVYQDSVYRKAFEVNPLGWGAALVDPDVLLGDYYVTGSTRNFSGYSNPEYDDLFAKQSRTADPAERRKIVWEMQRILLRDVPIAIAYWSNVPYARWKEVRGFIPPTVFFNAFGYQEIWLAK